MANVTKPDMYFHRFLLHVEATFPWSDKGGSLVDNLYQLKRCADDTESWNELSVLVSSMNEWTESNSDVGNCVAHHVQSKRDETCGIDLACDSVLCVKCLSG